MTYARCYSGRPGNAPLKMHRLIMERMLGHTLDRHELIDHVNGNPLDNRRENLRLATAAQNCWNTTPRAGCKSAYKGVGFANDGRTKCWMAYVNFDSQRFYIGKYYTEEEAAWMRDQWALALHGEFARLNFDYVPIGNKNGSN